MKSYRQGVIALILLLGLGLGVRAEGDEPALESATPEKGILHKVVMYVPNRVLDLVDIFRLRLRAGPGLAVHAQATELLSFYAGSYKSVYAGLPGPRETAELRSFAGREDLRGLVLLGVDATDDTPHHPGFANTEFAVGAHLLLVGAEIGLDPVQLGDFLAGLIGLDPRGDDR